MSNPVSFSDRSFSNRILDWFEDHGRKDLPWQQAVTPYKVWVSEIMLQQTRVETVIPYFEKFTNQFPGVVDLANADQGEVLHLWSGLGYYARARNLHKAAKVMRDEYGGEFPVDLEAVMALPGIGRSTAGAILSLACGQCEAILDGNVKRVLARHAGIDGWPGTTRVARALWAVAEQRTPEKKCAEYTQAMMDLGAMLCVRNRPLCDLCPVSEDCIARKDQRTHELPSPKPKKTLPDRYICMLLLQNEEGAVLMQLRPDRGIWGGLWSFPEFESIDDARGWCCAELGCDLVEETTLPILQHTFSHFRLHITPYNVRAATPTHRVMEGEDWVWYKDSVKNLGVASPVNTLLRQLQRS